MGDNRNGSVYNRFDLLCHFKAAFQLDRLGSALFYQAARINNRVIHRSLVRHKRHVRHNQSVFRSSGDRFCVVNHILHGDRQGIFISQAHHSHGITYQNRVNPRLIHKLGKGIIVCRQHGNLLFFLFGFFKGSCCIFHWSFSSSNVSKFE